MPSACRGIRARKLLFGNEIANPPAGQHHVPNCANDIFDVRRDRSDRAASRCGTNHLVIHVRRLRVLVVARLSTLRPLYNHADIVAATRSYERCSSKVRWLGVPSSPYQVNGDS